MVFVEMGGKHIERLAASEQWPDDAGRVLPEVYDNGALLCLDRETTMINVCQLHVQTYVYA